MSIPPVRRAHMASQLRKETHSRPSLTHTNCMPGALYAVCRHAMSTYCRLLTMSGFSWFQSGGKLWTPGWQSVQVYGNNKNCFWSLQCKDRNESPAFHFLGQIHHLKVQTLLNLYNQHREIGLQPVLKTHKTSLTIQKVYYMNSSKYCPASGEKCRYAMSHKKFKVNSC